MVNGPMGWYQSFSLEPLILRHWNVAPLSAMPSSILILSCWLIWCEVKKTFSHWRYQNLRIPPFVSPMAFLGCSPPLHFPGFLLIMFGGPLVFQYFLLVCHFWNGETMYGAISPFIKAVLSLEITVFTSNNQRNYFFPVVSTHLWKFDYIWKGR